MTINGTYDLELERLAKEISSKNYKKVCLQFPDGLKPQSMEIVNKLKEQAQKTEFFVWLGSCYGACDTPQTLNQMKIDLLVQFGHNKFQKSHSWKE